MTLVDFERAWLHLKRHIGEKRSHGQKELAVAMAEIEVECMLDDPQMTTTDPDPKELSEPGMSDPNHPLLVKETGNGTGNTDRPGDRGRIGTDAHAVR